MNKTIQHWYAHIDLDAFFASVEQLDHPEYKGKPVIVGGLPEDRRGVVSTASYEARKFGVHSAMPTYQAYKLCPQGIFVHGNYKRYSELSYQIMTIFKDYSPEVNQMSIDEAFIDLTGTEKLFGQPEETCLKIKERIKKETGLTVSIGLAPTKYIAKICSGYKKPDGFYKVEPGSETDFMLNLPLEKVWGVGEKTLQNLHQKGIYTTKNIYEKDLDSLQFLFGSNTAAFLYDVVRGGHNEMFRKESKNHSISAEKTFPFDLTDSYTLETEILELAQGVMFRLLKEKGYSRTVFLKLRYEDFTTVSIQKTLDYNIKTLDSFYEQLVLLFNEKKEKDRGVRLLGVGFDNVDNTERPEQQSLFDDNSKKKQQVEKAILQLNQKHPEIKVQKARTLKFIFTFLFFGLLNCFFQIPISAQNKTENTGAGTILSDTLSSPSQSDDDLFLFDINREDKSKFEYKLTGFWNMDFSTSLLSTFGNKTPLGFSYSPPVFKQEIELSAWFLLNNQWYFDTSFADGFEKNTFTMGYKNGGYLNSAQISNRNIGMNNNYSASYFGYGLKGGKNQAPGIAIQFVDFKNNKWKGDLIVRYDMTNSKTATFYGLNSVTDTYLETSSFLYGKKFIFPQTAIGNLRNIKAIYVENSKGDYTDENKKRYVKLSDSQYAVYENLCELNFTNDAQTNKQGNRIPSILVTFTEDSIVSNIISAAGSYEDNSSFAGQIQQLFTPHNIKLTDYTYNLETTIDHSKALVIQNSSGFSPFLSANLYDCGILQNADVSIISKSTDKISSIFTAIQVDENDSLLENFFSDNHFYTQIISINTPDVSLQNAENRYPLAAANPKIYLNLKGDEDTVLRVRNYTALSSLQIGTNAVEGSVYVYKNGVIDTGASYNPNTGIITLSSEIQTTDKITVQYQEDSQDFSGGTLSSGLGFVYNFTPDFIWDMSITSRIPLSPKEKYSTVNSSLNSFTALTNGITYSSKAFNFSDKLALAIQNPDQTGTLLANTNNQYINQTYYLSSSSGYPTKVIPVISDVILEELNNCSVNQTRGIQDSFISGYAIPLYWDFSTKTEQTNNWASVDIQLGNGDVLCNSSYLEFAFKPQLSAPGDFSAFDVYLQLGISASSQNTGEDSSLIRTWKISEINTKTITALDLSSSKWQTVKIALDDIDRTFLTSNYDARLIILKRVPGETNLTGRILAGPYEPYKQSLFINCPEEIQIHEFTELTADSPSSAELKIEKNYSARLHWKTETSPESLQSTEITTVSNFKAAAFDSYKSINLDFAFVTTASEISSENTDYGLTFILDRESSAVNQDGIYALKLQIKDISKYINTSLKYHTLSVNLEQNKVYIDKEPLLPTNYTLYINKNISPSRQKIVINLKQNDKFYSEGDFYINNLYYSDSSAYASLQNNVNLKYVKEGNILTLKNHTILQNGFISLDSTQTATTLSEFSINTSAESGITLFNLQITGDINTKYSSTSNKFYISQAGHHIQTASPFMKVLQATENYRIDTDSSSLSKSDSAVLDFEKIGLKITGKADASDQLNLRNQTLNLLEEYTLPFNKNSFKLNSEFTGNQKINTTLSKSPSFCSDKYFTGWTDISKLQFSKGEENASLRNLNYTIETGFNFSEGLFIPELKYNTNSNYLSATENKYIFNQNLLFRAPFKIKKQQFSINYDRKASNSILSSAQNDYFGDTNLLFQNAGKNNYFFTSIPLVELFDKKITEKISNNTPDFLYSTYSSKYEIQWKRPLLNSKQDLYIPGSSTFAVERDTKRSDSLSDIYQLKLTLSNMAVNNFGSKAPEPVYTWFESDELISSVTGTVKIPSDQVSSVIYNLTLYSQFLIYINDKASLKTAFDFQIDTGNYWNAKSTVIYSRPGKTSLAVDLTKYLFPSTNDITFTILQKETANLQIGKNTTQWFQQYDYQHTTSLAFLKNYSVDLGIGTTFTWNQITACSLAVNLSLSGKMKF